jgi:predicted RNase H-like HicB family nuclease
VKFSATMKRRPDGIYIAVCPDIPGAQATGRNRQEAAQALAQAIQKALDPTIRISAELVEFRFYESA